MPISDMFNVNFSWSTRLGQWSGHKVYFNPHVLYMYITLYVTLFTSGKIYFGIH